MLQENWSHDSSSQNFKFLNFTNYNFFVIVENLRLNLINSILHILSKVSAAWL